MNETNNKELVLEGLNLCLTDSAGESKVILVKNDSPKKSSIVPMDDISATVSSYVSSLIEEGSNFTFDDHGDNTVDSLDGKTIDVSELKIWELIKESTTSIGVTNSAKIVSSDFNCDGNVLVVKIKLKSKENVYLLTYHRNIATWFTNGKMFLKNIQGKFVEMKGDILTINGHFGAVVYKEKCYVFDEYNFNKVFKYDEKQRESIILNKANIHNLSCLSDGTDFYTRILESKQQMGRMAKFIATKRFASISNMTAADVKNSLCKRAELKELLMFDKNNKLIIDDKSFKIIMDVFRGTIVIDIITEETMGIQDGKIT